MCKLSSEWDRCCTDVTQMRFGFMIRAARNTIKDNKFLYVHSTHSCFFAFSSFAPLSWCALYVTHLGWKKRESDGHIFLLCSRCWAMAGRTQITFAIPFSCILLHVSKCVLLCTRHHENLFVLWLDISLENHHLQSEIYHQAQRATQCVCVCATI